MNINCVPVPAIASLHHNWLSLIVTSYSDVTSELTYDTLTLKWLLTPDLCFCRSGFVRFFSLFGPFFWDIGIGVGFHNLCHPIALSLSALTTKCNDRSLSLSLSISLSTHLQEYVLMAI